jgi:thiol-disulfide isomerase/thioredoxin
MAFGMWFKIRLIVVCLFISGAMFPKKLKEGIYRGVLVLNEQSGLELPFNFEIKYKGKKPVIVIRNADERIEIDEITVKGDSVNFKMPVFDTEFRTKLVDGNLEGHWINHYRTVKNIIPFKAVYGEARRFLSPPGKTNPVLEGKWEVTFSPGLKDSSKAIGVFHHLEQTDYLTGTFLTETGDYRYLEGMRNGNKFSLSCFDGSHAYLFTGEINGEGMIDGKFYSGAHHEENWTAKKNESFRLRDAEEITFLKNKDEKIRFSFPDPENHMISLEDKKFQNKPVILQLMGTWCPNCKDESIYLSGVYDQYKAQGLEIIALAFEKTEDFGKAKENVERLKKRLNIQYDVLITQKVGKDKAGEVMTALNKVAAFPTTIFLNKQHQVVKVHTGFSGPATGKEYELFKERTENLIKTLLKE